MLHLMIVFDKYMKLTVMRLTFMLSFIQFYFQVFEHFSDIGKKLINQTLHLYTKHSQYKCLEEKQESTNDQSKNTFQDTDKMS